MYGTPQMASVLPGDVRWIYTPLTLRALTSRIICLQTPQQPLTNVGGIRFGNRTFDTPDTRRAGLKAIR